MSWSCCKKLKRIISPILRILKDVDIRFYQDKANKKCTGGQTRVILEVAMVNIASCLNQGVHQT